jgi:hypothetical protein
MTDRQLMQQALDALNSPNFGVHSRAISALQERLAHCDRCGKRLGGEGDIHTCTPDPIGDAQDKLIAELAAQPEQEPIGEVRNSRAYFYSGMYTDKTDAPDGTKIYTTPPAAAQPESVQPVSMYEDWYDSNSCSHCGMVGGHVKTCRHYTTPPAAQPAAPVQPEKESVIFCMHWEDRWGVNHYVDPKEPHPAQAKPLYTTPPAPAALTQEPVSMRMPKAGDKVICLEDESLATVVSLTAGGSPDIVFSDGSRGTYLLHEFAELFGYATPPAAQPAPVQPNALDWAEFEADEDIQMLMDRDMGDN